MTMAETVGTTMGMAPKPKGKLGKVARAMKAPADLPTYDDPLAELKRLVLEHEAVTKRAVAMRNMVEPKKNRETGEVIPSRVPDDLRVETRGVVKHFNARADKLKGAMLRELRKVPVYQQFLVHVFGIGEIAAAYLVTKLDPRVGERRDPKTGELLNPGAGEKPSDWRRYCGLAVVNGRSERPAAGEINKYNKAMRTRLYQAFVAMWKNAAKFSVCEAHAEARPAKGDAKGKAAFRAATLACPACKATAIPNGTATKYLDIWIGYKHRMAHSSRLDVATGKIDGDPRKGPKWVHETGRRKATDVFIEDLYIVWRSLEGLPVWPAYHAAVLGYSHGGKTLTPKPDGSFPPKMLTSAEALAVVGDVAGRPAAAPIEESDEDGEEDETIGDE